jgi:hypothetical protein
MVRAFADVRAQIDVFQASAQPRALAEDLEIPIKGPPDGVLDEDAD